MLNQEGSIVCPKELRDLCGLLQGLLLLLFYLSFAAAYIVSPFASKAFARLPSWPKKLLVSATKSLLSFQLGFYISFGGAR